MLIFLFAKPLSLFPVPVEGRLYTNPCAKDQNIPHQYLPSARPRGRADFRGPTSRPPDVGPRFFRSLRSDLPNIAAFLFSEIRPLQVYFSQFRRFSPTPPHISRGFPE